MAKVLVSLILTCKSMAERSIAYFLLKYRDVHKVKLSQTIFIIAVVQHREYPVLLEITYPTLPYRSFENQIKYDD